MTGRTYVSIAAVAFVAFAVVEMAAQLNAQPASLLQFHSSIQRYVQLHRQIEIQLPPFRTRSDAHEIFESSNAMAAALQTARAAAREGDIFTRELAALLRVRVADALAAHGFLPEEIVASTLEEADEESPLPVVNGRFPWRRGAAMWPCVLTRCRSCRTSSNTGSSDAISCSSTRTPISSSTFFGISCGERRRSVP
jgi:hypothetical protein